MITTTNTVQHNLYNYPNKYMSPYINTGQFLKFTGVTLL